MTGSGPKQTPAGQTPSQTIGPFFHDALMRDAVTELDPQRQAGSPIRIVGSVIDGAGEVVSDAMVEVWQADSGGRYRHPADGRSADVPSAFVGFGRVGTDDDGRFGLTTVMPGTVPGPEGSVQAPHLNVQVFARGLLDRVNTRIYFPDHPANTSDPVLSMVPPDRRSTLIATSKGSGEYRFDVVLQGPRETVFFEL